MSYAIPGPLAAAFLTNRPELARQTTLESADQVAAFAERLVHDAIIERERVQVIAHGVAMCKSNLVGALAWMERLEEAMKLIESGAEPEVVRQAMVNPKAKEHA